MTGKPFGPGMSSKGNTLVQETFSAVACVAKQQRKVLTPFLNNNNILRHSVGIKTNTGGSRFWRYSLNRWPSDDDLSVLMKCRGATAVIVYRLLFLFFLNSFGVDEIKCFWDKDWFVWGERCDVVVVPIGILIMKQQGLGPWNCLLNVIKLGGSYVDRNKLCCTINIEVIVQFSSKLNLEDLKETLLLFLFMILWEERSLGEEARFLKRFQSLLWKWTEDFFHLVMSRWRLTKAITKHFFSWKN